MKSKMFTVFALAAITLIACKKDEEVVVTPAGPGSAVLKGTLYAPIDLSNDTTDAGLFVLGWDNEFAPSGTKITAIIDSEDLQSNPQAGYTYEKLKFTALVGENGRYTFSGLPATAEDISIELRFNDFEEVQVQFDPSNNASENKIFHKNDESVMIYDGGTIIKEYDYTSN